MAATHTFARLTTAGQGRRLFLLSWIAYAAAYVGRYNYSAVMSAITAEGTLTLSAAGAVSTGYFVCYAAGQILCGILSQKASPFGAVEQGDVVDNDVEQKQDQNAGRAGIVHFATSPEWALRASLKRVKKSAASTAKRIMPWSRSAKLASTLE